MTTEPKAASVGARHVLVNGVVFTAGFLLAFGAQVWFWVRPSRPALWVETAGGVTAVAAVVGLWWLSRRLQRHDHHRRDG